MPPGRFLFDVCPISPNIYIYILGKFNLAPFRKIRQSVHIMNKSHILEYGPK